MKRICAITVTAATFLMMPFVSLSQVSGSESIDPSTAASLECCVKRLTRLIVFVKVELACKFGALGEFYRGWSSDVGIDVRVNFSENVKFKAYNIESPDAPWPPGALAGTYTGSTVGAGAVFVAGEKTTWTGGKDGNVVLAPEDTSGGGLGLTFTMGSLELALTDSMPAECKSSMRQ
jgi:hypothetical protein